MLRPVETLQIPILPVDFFTCNPSIDVPSNRNLTSQYTQGSSYEPGEDIYNCCIQMPQPRRASRIWNREPQTWTLASANSTSASRNKLLLALCMSDEQTWAGTSKLYAERHRVGDCFSTLSHIWNWMVTMLWATLWFARVSRSGINTKIFSPTDVNIHRK